MRLVDISIPVDVKQSNALYIKEIARSLSVQSSKIKEYKIVKKSIDARGVVKYRYRVAVSLHGEDDIPKYNLEPFNYVGNKQEVIIVGCGPAGLFAALKLIQRGFKPIILERGKDVHARKFDMAKLSREHIVNPHSNYCFGEGGAGTFSDGKLYTRSTKKGDVNEVLNLFVKFGAPESILIETHAHIGSDKLPSIIENMRNFIIECGGEVYFNSWVYNLQRIADSWSVYVEDVASEARTKRIFNAESVILATGHSAKDIYQLFYKNNWEIEAKGFALGVRVEHPQALINNIRYGKYKQYLPAAEYSAVTQVDGRGVFSFCMCPGGLLVPAATGSGELVLNGMSNSKRNSRWANAGVVVQIEPGDLPSYYKYGPLGMLKFQQDVERSIYSYTNSLTAPAQLLTDFVSGVESKSLNETSYVPGAVSAPLHKILPEFVAKRLQMGFLDFNKKMRGYLTPKANILAVESRTSSSVRILRDNITYNHISLKNLYPCGEGAGYAGGIVSSAIDGINVANGIHHHSRS